jgi:hypothetical protein
MTTSPPPSSSPSVGHLVEPLYVKPVPIESLGARLAPLHHLARPLATGWPESAGEPSAGGEGDDPLFLSAGLKGSGGLDHFRWVSQVHRGPSPVAQCWLFFSIDLFKSIQI